MDDKQKHELMNAFYLAYLLGPETLLAAAWFVCGCPHDKGRAVWLSALQAKTFEAVPGKCKTPLDLLTTENIPVFLDEIGIKAIVLPCPMCATDVAPLRDGEPCPLCEGDRKILYGIGDATFKG